MNKSFLSASLVFIACLLPAAVFSYKHPAYNFDMLGYMALVLQLENKQSPEQLHAATYSEAEKSLPPTAYYLLTDSLSSRREFVKDPEKFSSILPIYNAKPLYIWLSWLAHQTGIPLAKATVVPSIFAFLMTGLLLFYWLRRYLGMAYGFVAALLISYSVFSINLAGLSTPDFLSAFFFLFSLFFVMEKRSFPVFLVLALLAVLCRLDNVINYFFILSFLSFHPRWKIFDYRQYGLAVAILAVAFVFINLQGSSYGWNFFNYFNYASRIDFSRDFHQGFSVRDHLKLMESKLATAMISSHFSFFLFLVLLLLAFPGTTFRKLSLHQAFALLLTGIICFRFLLLPDLSDRFYFGFYILILLLLVKTIRRQPEMDL